MTERHLYRRVAGRTMGPYPPARLRPLVKDGRISPLDRFSYDGMTWAPAPDFPELMREPAPTAPVGEEPFGFTSVRDDAAADFVIPDIDVRGEDAEDDASTQQLMKTVFWVTGVGGGLIVLMIMLTVFTAIRGTVERIESKAPRSAINSPTGATQTPQLPPRDEATSVDETAEATAGGAGAPGE